MEGEGGKGESKIERDEEEKEHKRGKARREKKDNFGETRKEWKKPTLISEGKNEENNKDVGD